jgi:hypothetical protein
MTPDRKAELYAECDALCARDFGELTPAQEAWADATRAVWGGDEITPAKERWAARQLHLPADRRGRAIRSAYAASATAMQNGLA